MLTRHLHGDWGDVTEDALQNERAVLDLRILSCYAIASGLSLWIITEADIA